MIKETEYIRVFGNGVEMAADFLTRKGTHDPNIVQEVWNQGFYKAPGYEIKAGDRVVDIGAHIGSFTVWALKQGASVVAFEPDDDNYKLLEHNVSYNLNPNMGEVELHPVAVKGIEGVYFIDRGAEGQPNTGGYKIVDEMMGESVEGLTAINPYLVFEGGKKVDYLKLDCEGSEYEILHFMDEHGFLQLVEKIVMEWHFDKTKADEIVEVLKVNGFTITDFSTNPDAPEPLGRIMARKL